MDGKGRYPMKAALVGRNVDGWSESALSDERFPLSALAMMLVAAEVTA